MDKENMDSTLLISRRKSNITWLVHDYTKITIKSEPNNKSRTFFLHRVGLSFIKINYMQNSKDG